MNIREAYWILGISVEDAGEGVAKLGVSTSEEVKRLEEPNH